MARKAITVRELAEQMSLSCGTVRRLAASGGIPGAVKLQSRTASQWRFPADTADRMLQQGPPVQLVPPPKPLDIPVGIDLNALGFEPRTGRAAALRARKLRESA